MKKIIIFDIQTELVLVNDEQTIARAICRLRDDKGNTLKKCLCNKKRNKKDFF